VDIDMRSVIRYNKYLAKHVWKIQYKQMIVPEDIKGWRNQLYMLNMELADTGFSSEQLKIMLKIIYIHCFCAWHNMLQEFYKIFTYISEDKISVNLKPLRQQISTDVGLEYKQLDELEDSLKQQISMVREQKKDLIGRYVERNGVDKTLQTVQISINQYRHLMINNYIFDMVDIEGKNLEQLIWLKIFVKTLLSKKHVNNQKKIVELIDEQIRTKMAETSMSITEYAKMCKTSLNHIRFYI
jgi:hypothetical protein